jgi:hypothetical protein
VIITVLLALCGIYSCRNIETCTLSSFPFEFNSPYYRENIRNLDPFCDCALGVQALYCIHLVQYDIFSCRNIEIVHGVAFPLSSKVRIMEKGICNTDLCSYCAKGTQTLFHIHLGPMWHNSMHEASNFAGEQLSMGVQTSILQRRVSAIRTFAVTVQKVHRHLLQSSTWYQQNIC